MYWSRAYLWMYAHMYMRVRGLNINWWGFSYLYNYPLIRHPQFNYVPLVKNVTQLQHTCLRRWMQVISYRSFCWSTTFTNVIFCHLVSCVVVFIQIDVLRIKLYLKFTKGKKRNIRSKVLLLYCVSSLRSRNLLRYYI